MSSKFEFNLKKSTFKVVKFTHLVGTFIYKSMTKGINYLFYLKAPRKVLEDLNDPKSKSELLLPVYFRITVAGKRTEMSTGESTIIGMWHQAKGSVKGTGEKEQVINASLDSFLNDAKKACQYLTDRNKLISPVIIKNQMLGIGPTSYSLVQCFENFIKEITLKIGSDYEIGTLKNYKVTLGHLKEFISKQYHTKDIPLKDLNYKFITEFELMCKTEWGCKRSSTSAKHIQRIRRVIGIVLANEWLEKTLSFCIKASRKSQLLSSLHKMS
ncbi:MAG: phage integrase SAM-like domain and Arm DNA-binding domain-containing protein [Ferruginibacter sp.]